MHATVSRIHTSGARLSLHDVAARTVRLSPTLAANAPLPPDVHIRPATYREDRRGMAEKQ